MLKIALPSKDNQIDSHFGHCDYFTVVSIDENKNIVSKEVLDSGNTCGCKSGIATTLREQGVTVMLAGNMGQGAYNTLVKNNIQVIRGCVGKVEDVLTEYLKGTVVDSKIECEEHNHHHENGHDHTCNH